MFLILLFLSQKPVSLPGQVMRCKKLSEFLEHTFNKWFSDDSTRDSKCTLAGIIRSTFLTSGKQQKYSYNITLKNIYSYTLKLLKISRVGFLKLNVQNLFLYWQINLNTRSKYSYVLFLLFLPFSLGFLSIKNIYLISSLQNKIIGYITVTHVDVIVTL